MPAVGIQNFNAEEIGDTFAVFTWDMDVRQINATPTQLNGEFRGFKVRCRLQRINITK